MYIKILNFLIISIPRWLMVTNTCSLKSSIWIPFIEQLSIHGQQKSWHAIINQTKAQENSTKWASMSLFDVSFIQELLQYLLQRLSNGFKADLLLSRSVLLKSKSVPRQFTVVAMLLIAVLPTGYMESQSCFVFFNKINCGRREAQSHPVCFSSEQDKIISILIECVRSN